MFFTISFDGCAMESPLRARSPVAALALAQEAERNGCGNVTVELPGGDRLPLSLFAARYSSPA